VRILKKIIVLLVSVLVSLTISFNHGNAVDMENATNDEDVIMRTSGEEGSWKDTFDNGSGIFELNNVILIDGYVRLVHEEYIVDANTIALWHFNEGSGTTVYDATTNNNDGTINVNGANWTTGKFGDCLDFDGVDDYVELPDSPSLSITGPEITLEAWVNPIFGQQGTIVHKDWHYSLCRLTLGEICYADSVTWDYATIGKYGVTPDSRWSHVAATFNGTTICFYINGQLVGSKARGGSITDNAILPFIGAYAHGNTPDAAFFWGSIDEVRISNIARTSFQPYNISGVLTSTIIAPPDLGEWANLTISKTDVDGNNYITVSVLDAVTNLTIDGFADLHGTNIDLSTIDEGEHRTLKLQANFYGDGSKTPILHAWEVNWRKNSLPIVESFTYSASSILRTQSMTISAVGFDIETPQSELIPTFQYKGSSDTAWQTEYLSSLVYVPEKWDITFTPPANSALGYYDFRVRFNESFGGASRWEYLDAAIKVSNNKPTAPVVEFIPLSPSTSDDLVATIMVESEDVEGEHQITYTYQWYKNEIIQNSLSENYSTSLTNTISHINTNKYDVWKCIVIPNDGNENGPGGKAEVIIHNSGPIVNNSIGDFNISEDGSDSTTVNLLSVFYDADNDRLRFTAQGWNKIRVEINQETGYVTFTPEAQWNGKETITFYANDSVSEVSDEVVVTVTPEKDLPVLDVPNRLSVKEDELLNVTITVLNPDGNTLSFSSNLTDGIGDDDLDNFKLIPDAINPNEAVLTFLPTNEDVGILYVTITVSDNIDGEISRHLTIEIENVNDPPEIPIITSPTDKETYSVGKSVEFIGICDDPDLHIPNSSEILTYTWSSHHEGVLGTGDSFIAQSLKPGTHVITLMVSDAEGEVSTSTPIIITIKGDEPSPGGSISTIWWWVVVIIIVVVIAIILATLIYYRKLGGRKQTKIEKQEQMEKDKDEPALQEEE
jgi:hypothetical protein